MSAGEAAGWVAVAAILGVAPLAYTLGWVAGRRDRASAVRRGASAGGKA